MTERIARAVGRLFGAFSRELDDLTLSSWIGGLGDLDEDAVERGVIEAIRTLKRWPTVADVRELAGEGEVGAALEGFELALQHVRSGFKLEVPEVVDRAMRLAGGWESLAMSKITETHWIRTRFLEAWPHAARAVEQQRTLGEGSEQVSQLIEGLAGNLGAGAGRKPREEE